MKRNEYVVYKGENLICIGTAKECAEVMNVTPAYIKWMTTPTGKRRLSNRKNPEKCTMAEKLEEDEDE